MTDIPINESREDRYGKTDRKHISLTEEAADLIQAYADRHALFFSVAIETLALMGLGHTTADSLPRLVTNLLERTLSRQFNRFAKLLALTAVTAEEINHKTDVLLLQTIWREARVDPDNFIENMWVSDDPYEQPDGQVRQIRNEVRADAHTRALSRLKEPLGHKGVLWDSEATDEA